MSFIIGVVASVCAAVICALCVRSFRRWRSRNGPLAGWWWQITYPPRRHDTVLGNSSPPVGKDETNHNSLAPDPADSPQAGVMKKDETEVSSWALPDLTTFPWSIELLRVRHSGDRLEAKAWRVYDNHFERTWSSEGWICEGSMVDGRYRCDRGEGGHGTFQLWVISSGRCCGVFSESKTTVVSNSLKFEFVGAPLEWIRVGSELDTKVRAWFKTPTYSFKDVEAHWPRRVRRKMRSILYIKLDLPWFAKLGYAAGLTSPMIPAELEKLRRELEKHRREQDRQESREQDEPESQGPSAE